MNDEVFALAEKLVSSSYVRQAQQARRHRESLAPRDTALEVLAREKDKDRDKRG